MKNVNIILSICVGCIAGCREQKASKRYYQELIFARPASWSTSPEDAPSTDAEPRTTGAGSSTRALTWETPPSWVEKKGTNMRLATFTAGATECSIVVLGGVAGGVESNIKRWMGQINVEADELRFKRFIEELPTFVTAGNSRGVWVDLSVFMQDADDAIPSILAAIIEKNGSTIFVKMTGSKGALQAEKEHFKQLCVSLR